MWKRVFSETQTAFGKLDVLGEQCRCSSTSSCSNNSEEAEFHRQFNTNVLGLPLTTQAALEHFNDKGGSVINVSSVASQARLPGAWSRAATGGAGDLHNSGARRRIGRA